jgi:hypothetical protein
MNYELTARQQAKLSWFYPRNIAASPTLTRFETVDTLGVASVTIDREYQDVVLGILLPVCSKVVGPITSELT